MKLNKVWKKKNKKLEKFRLLNLKERETKDLKH